MRISDWSSDVCSSDLIVEVGIDLHVAGVDLAHLRRRGQRGQRQAERCQGRKGEAGERLPHRGPPKIEPRRYGETCVHHDSLWPAGTERAMTPVEFKPARIIQIGRASCREKVVKYVEIP